VILTRATPCRTSERMTALASTATVDAAPNFARLPARHGTAEVKRENGLGFFDAGNRRKVAVIVTADGRRVHVPLDPNPLAVSLLDLLLSLPGLAGLLGLITGSRRDRGTRSGTRD
jgi:hypothetical protein